jgi:large subunit ribosomal protein L21
MYAVIRAGGKQYRVAPGDVLRLEALSTADGAKLELNDVLAVSTTEGQIASPAAGVVVTGEVLGEGRGKKVLVFHYKKKKQYKKLAGHRQPFTEVRITEIAVDGQKFSAPDLPKRKEPKAAVEAAGTAGATPKAEAKSAKPAAKKKAAPRKSTARKSSPDRKKK